MTKATLREDVVRSEAFRKEQRVIEVLNERTEQTPEWFIRAQRASDELDIQGIDFLVKIHVEGARKKIKVPVQLKSSVYGCHLFYAERKAYWLDRVPVLIVKDYHSDEEIRVNMFVLLQHVYERGYSFTEMLNTLRAAEIPPSLKAQTKRTRKKINLLIKGEKVL